MTIGDEDVGIVLTIPSKRPGPDGMRSVFNLAAWYVDKPHRWLAPRMLQKVVAQQAAVFTDLTPSAAAQQINRRLGSRFSTKVSRFSAAMDGAARAQTGARDSRGKRESAIGWRRI